MPRRRLPPGSYSGRAVRSLAGWIGPSNPYEARLFIGRRVGLKRTDGRPDCAILRAKRRDYTPLAVSRAFIDIRREQTEAPGATVVAANGYWGLSPGEREPSTVISASWIRTGKEPTRQVFFDNVLSAAEQLAERLCQRCIYLQVTDGGTGESVFYQVTGPRRRAKDYCG